MGTSRSPCCCGRATGFRLNEPTFDGTQRPTTTRRQPRLRREVDETPVMNLAKPTARSPAMSWKNEFSSPRLPRRAQRRHDVASPRSLATRRSRQHEEAPLSPAPHRLRRVPASRLSGAVRGPTSSIRCDRHANAPRRAPVRLRLAGGARLALPPRSTAGSGAGRRHGQPLGQK